MKLAPVITLPLSVALGLSLSCSDPPSPPAQAGVAITLSQGTGTCNLLNAGQVTTPPDSAGNVGAVAASLFCSLENAGCTPDQHVVVQGDAGTKVSCNVSPNGESFDVDLSVSITQKPGMQFAASGQVSSNGGTLLVSEYDNLSGHTLSDPGCVITISNNVGTVKKGAIWARFSCANFIDSSDIGGSSCAADGVFIFENCGG